MTPTLPHFVLAVSPSPRGFAFVLFEGPELPFDWGIKEIRGSQKNPRTIAEVKKLIRRYCAATIVLETTSAKDSHRGPRIRELLRRIVRLAEREGVAVRRCSRTHARKVFVDDNARTRPEIAKAVAARIPAFTPKLLPLRKIWMSEDPRQSLFDGAALGMTGYARGQRQDRPSRE